MKEKNPAAVALGKLGRGRKKTVTAQSAEARRRNGKLGGRPKKKTPPAQTAGSE